MLKLWVRKYLNFYTENFCLSKPMTFEYIAYRSQHLRFRYLSHCPALKAPVSLRKCRDLPVFSMLTYTKYVCRYRLRSNFSPLAPLITSAWGFEGGICAYRISTKISYSHPYEIIQGSHGNSKHNSIIFS